MLEFFVKHVAHSYIRAVLDATEEQVRQRLRVEYDKQVGPRSKTEELRSRSHETPRGPCLHDPLRRPFCSELLDLAGEMLIQANQLTLKGSEHRISSPELRDPLADGTPRGGRGPPGPYLWLRLNSLPSCGDK